MNKRQFLYTSLATYYFVCLRAWIKIKRTWSRCCYKIHEFKHIGKFILNHRLVEYYLPTRHLSGWCWYLVLSELIISDSVSFSTSCTVHVSGTGPYVYPLPLTTLQSISWLAVGDILASIINRATQHVSVLWNASKSWEKLFCPRSENVCIFVVIRYNYAR